MVKRFRILRWALVIPSAILAWFVAFFASLETLRYLTISCENSRREFCEWVDIDVFIILGASLAAVLVMLSATIVAPDRKRRTAKITYVIGFAIALILGILSTFWGAFIGSALTGLATLTLIQRRKRLPKEDLSLP